MIILSKSRNQYRLDEKGGFLIVISLAKLLCPVCEGELRLLGWRLRGVISAEANKVFLKIRRLRCCGCGKIHHELPDYIVPYKRYCAEVIENVISNNTESVPCEPSDIPKIKIWWLTMKDYFTNIFQAIAERMGVEPPKQPTFREIIQAVVNDRKWTFPGKLPGVSPGVQPVNSRPVRQ